MRAAVILDVDGTLLELAETPQGDETGSGVFQPGLTMLARAAQLQGLQQTRAGEVEEVEEP